MKYLQNDVLRLGLDDHGALVWLENLRSGLGNVIQTPTDGLFRMVLQHGENWEDVVFASEQSCEVTVQDTSAKVMMHGLKTCDGMHDIHVTLTLRLEGTRMCFDAEIDNRADVLVTDFYYPRIGAIRTLGRGKPDLLWPQQSGERYTNIGQYLAEDDKSDSAHTLSITYPGMASMCWTALEDGDQCMYLGCHDPLFHAAALRAVGSERQDVILEVDKLSFVRQGEVWKNPQSVLMLYTGSWRRGADVYAAWARTWRRKEDAPKWLRDMTGYFLVINKQQYGEELWPYNTLQELYDLALEHGCDTLGLFGWYHSGHDNQYPELVVSPTMGGAEALKEQIQQIRARGGHVTLYYQGHLLDIGTSYYQAIGHRLEGKTRWGTPYLEEYSKFHHSEYLRRYSKKLFATVCPSCPEWQELMAQRADWIASFGPNGMLYDQIGGMPAYPCFDDSHPHLHGKPSLSYTQGRLTLLDRIRSQAKTHGTEFGFMSEHITDVYSQFLDALHGIRSNPSAPGGIARIADADTQAPEVINDPAMFRYCFPDTIITLRNPRPYLSPRMVDYAFLYGFRYEMELRYLTDQEQVRANIHPDWKTYAYSVSELRRTYADLLLHGQYRASEGLHNENLALTTAVYYGEKRTGIALWNDTDKVQEVRCALPGFHIVRWQGVETGGEGCLDTMQPGQIALLLCEAEESV